MQVCSLPVRVCGPGLERRDQQAHQGEITLGMEDPGTWWP